MEVRCPRHPGASTIDSQLQDGDEPMAAKTWQPGHKPKVPKKRGTRHTDTQGKAEGGEGGNRKPPNESHIKLLLLATMINKRYGPKHVKFHACASVPKPPTTIGRSPSSCLLAG